MKTKKPDDLDRYIAQRNEKDAEFAAAYDSEHAEWELGQLLARPARAQDSRKRHWPAK